MLRSRLLRPSPDVPEAARPHASTGDDFAGRRLANLRLPTASARVGRQIYARAPGPRAGGTASFDAGALRLALVPILYHSPSAIVVTPYSLAGGSGYERLDGHWRRRAPTRGLHVCATALTESPDQRIVMAAGAPPLLLAQPIHRLRAS